MPHHENAKNSNDPMRRCSSIVRGSGARCILDLTTAELRSAGQPGAAVPTQAPAGGGRPDVTRWALGPMLKSLSEAFHPSARPGYRRHTAEPRVSDFTG